MMITPTGLAALVLCIPLLAIIAHLFVKNHFLLRQIVQLLAITSMLVVTISLLILFNKPIVIQAANWPAPFGISFVFDNFSRFMLVIFSIVTACISLYSFYELEGQKATQNYYLGYWLLFLGISGAITTGDLFNLYVWLELILISALLLLQCSIRNNKEVMFNYALINICGTLLMLLSIALIYAKTGTLNFADIARHLNQLSNDETLPIFLLLFLSMSLKGGLFPFYFWLPTSYPTPHISCTTLLSSLTTKAVMLIMLRLICLFKPFHTVTFTTTLVLMSLATMLLGVMGAAIRFDFRKILSFHVVSQLGYIALGLAIKTPLAIVGALYFLIHNVFTKTTLFMVSGVVEKSYGTGSLNKLGSVATRNKSLAIVFFISAFSLAGFPPFSGFWGKYILIKAALNQHYYTSATLMILVSVMTLFSMNKIWQYAYYRSKTTTRRVDPTKMGYYAPLGIGILLVLALFMGIYPDSILNYLSTIAKDLSHPTIYINTVLIGVRT